MSTAPLLHSRLVWLDSLVQNEQSLIKCATHAELRHRPDGERSKVIAKYLAEADKLLAWESYARRCVQNEFSSLPKQPIEKWEGEYLSRSRAAWAALLSSELELEEDGDPLMGLLVDFISFMMVYSLACSAITMIQPLSHPLFDELSRRLIPFKKEEDLTRPRRKETITSASALKPKPPRSRA